MQPGPSPALVSQRSGSNTAAMAYSDTVKIKVITKYLISCLHILLFAKNVLNNVFYRKPICCWSSPCVFLVARAFDGSI